jgi:hypothetical protein
MLQRISQAIATYVSADLLDQHFHSGNDFVKVHLRIIW